MNGEILSFDSVDISFDDRTVVNDISFSLHQGEILGVVGESGSGKSTIIRSILGLLNDPGAVMTGSIRYMDKILTEMSEREMRQIRGAEIGMIFQDAKGSFTPIRTIGTQILESMEAHGKIDKVQAKSRTLELFEKLGLKDADKIWNSYPFELSGGMNQRVGVAVAMLMNPSILLADEPTSALDVAVQKQVVDELMKLRELFGTSIIIVSHDIGVISAMADKILVLKDGRAMEYGSAKNVLEHPQNDYTKLLLSCVPRLRRK